MLENDLVILQGCAIGALLLIAVFGGWLPYMFRNKKQFTTVLSYLNCMSGGILLGVALLHIFPETGEVLNEKTGGFPMSYCISFVGMILMVIMIKIGHNHSHGHALEHEHDAPHTGETEELNDHDSHSHEETCEHDHHEKRWVTVVMLLIGLFIHDVSEGLALGFQQELQPAIYLFIGIFLHKWCDVTCQVICGIREGLSVKQNLFFMIPLVLATPVAQFIAFMISYFADGNNESDALKITEDFFMSFASGTFTAIAFVEIIGEEFAHRPKKQILFRALALIAGFVFIAITSIIDTIAESDED